MWLLCIEPVSNIIKYVLANYLTWLGVILVLNQWFRHTLCIRYITKIILSSFGNIPVNKTKTLGVRDYTKFMYGSLCNEPVNQNRHYLLANSLTSSWVTLVLDQWFKQTLCVRYFTEIILGSFGDVTINKIRQFVLSNILGLLWDRYV